MFVYAEENTMTWGESEKKKMSESAEKKYISILCGEITKMRASHNLGIG